MHFKPRYFQMQKMKNNSEISWTFNPYLLLPKKKKTKSSLNHLTRLE